MTRIIIEIVTKTKIGIKTKTDPEMTAMTELEVEKKIATMMIEKMVLKQNLKECKKFYNGWVKEKMK